MIDLSLINIQDIDVIQDGRYSFLLSKIRVEEKSTGTYIVFDFQLKEPETGVLHDFPYYCRYNLVDNQCYRLDILNKEMQGVRNAYIKKTGNKLNSLQNLSDAQLTGFLSVRTMCNSEGKSYQSLEHFTTEEEDHDIQ